MLHRTMAVMGVVAVLACTAVLHADEANNVVERFTFTAANAPQDALAKDGRLQLVIKRWSTDEERELMEKAAAEPGNLLDSFRHVGGIGYLQWPGGLEYTVRYARRTPTADGGSEIVLVAERPLWIWWDKDVEWSSEPAYTVVHLRVNKDGVGQGHASIRASIKADGETGVALADLNQQPLITDLRREAVS